MAKIGEALLEVKDSSWKRVELENNPEVTLNGFYVTNSGNKEASKGYIIASTKENDYFTLQFYGNKILLRGYLGYSISYKVDIDGEEETINLKSIRDGYGVVYEKTNLETNFHTITVTSLSVNCIFDTYDIASNLSSALVLLKDEYKTYLSKQWKTVTTSIPTVDDYLKKGIADISTIPESAWAELEGEIELCYYTDDPNKTEASFNIETEPFTLAEEFDDQTIKIIEYTDNPEQEDSSITLETEPFTFYEEVGDSFDVLYYTDDPDKTEAELEINHNYSPLDELDGDFDLVTWTMEEEAEVQEELKTIFKEKIEDGDLYGVTVDLSKGTINIM